MVIKSMLKGKEMIIRGLVRQHYWLLDKFLPAIIKKAFTNRAIEKLKLAQQSSISTTPVRPLPMGA